jgi:hypothetical protein
MSYDYYFTASREEYTRAFGNSGITGFKYARKTSALLVSFGVLAIFTALTWVVRKNKYDQIKKHVVFAAVNDLALTSGGNSESIHVRKLCLYYIDKIKTGTSATPGAAAGTPASGKKGKKDKGKQALAPSNASAAVGSEEVKDEAALLSKLSDHFGKFAPPTNHTLPKELDRELQKHCFEHFCGVITEHVYSDFGAGYRKPRVPDDLLPYILSIFFFSSLPKTIYSTARWRYRRHAKMEYDESEVLWLTIDTMGLRWDLLNEDQRKACLERKIWEEGALEKWDFEQNVALYGEKKAKKIREYSQRAENGEDMGGDY